MNFELNRNERKFKSENLATSPSRNENLRRRNTLSELARKNVKPPLSHRLFQPTLESIDFLVKAWTEIFKTPYLGANLSAGITVAAVALPLNLALAIAAGLPPTAGLIAGALGGSIAAIFGGSRFQATGPAAALNAMVFSIVHQFGASGAAAAALIAGALQLVLSLASAGKLMRFIPEAVLLGFTTGVGIKLLDSQIPKLFGVDWSLYTMLSHGNNPIWLHEVAWPAVVCGLFMLVLLLTCKSMPRFPAALVGIAITTELASFLDWPIHRVGDIPPIDLVFALPQFELNQWLHLIQMALPLGLLAAAESLLSAQAVDRMSGDRHHSNLEILGQGLGNLFSGLAGGMPVSGVIVRSSVNVQGGAKNRLGALFHAIHLIGSALFLGGILSKVPLASLAGLLCIIGFRLIEFSELFKLIQHHRLHAFGFLAATTGTVTNHIVMGLGIGMFAVWLGRDKSEAALQNSPVQKVMDAEAAVPSKQTSFTYAVLERGERWIQHLKEQASVPNTAFIHENASVIGRVILGRNVHIAAEASVRADEGTPFYIGDDTNVQDGVVIHALKKKWVRVHDQLWAVHIGKEVSLAHQALVHGPCAIGDRTFVGFKAVIHDSIVGQGCYIGIGALVVGVEIPDERYVPHGAIIDTKEKVIALTRVSPIHQHFNEDVVEVNKGLADAYRELKSEIST